MRYINACLTIISAVLLTNCSGDDSAGAETPEATVLIPGADDTPPEDVTIPLSADDTTSLISQQSEEEIGTVFCDNPNEEKDGEIDCQNDLDLDATSLTGDVNVDITLDAATEWTLSGPLAVKSGATLTIEAGTTIKANAGGTNVYLVVETGAKIMAIGTADKPITFTSAAINPRNGDWGGVLINGLAPISGGGTSTTEVLPLSYGGADAADNSGTFQYVILEYTGARINGEKEFNALTLYAVGTGTTINNIVINGGDDDGIEFFGGAVDVDNLLVINARDDMFDITQGYNTADGATNTNWYGIRTNGFTAVSEDTRGLELDGNLDGLNPEQSGQSNPTISGLTIVHGAAEPLVILADVIKIRRGSGASISNLLIEVGLNEAEDGSAEYSDLIDLEDARGDAVDGTSISYWVGSNICEYEEADDNKAGANETTIETDADNTGASTTVFVWYSDANLPTITSCVP